MNGLNLEALGSFDDVVFVQVTLSRWCWTNAQGLIGHLNRHGMAVCHGIDLNRFDLELLASAMNSNGNLSTVGDQNLLYRHGVLHQSGRIQNKT